MSRCEQITEDAKHGEIRCALSAGHTGPHEARIEGDERWGVYFRWGTSKELGDSWRKALAAHPRL